MRCALPRVAGEVVRLCQGAGRVGAIVTVSLTDAPGVLRARGSAVYRVGVAFSWRSDLGVLCLSDAQGERVEWSLVQVAEWLAVSLAGWPVTVEMEFQAENLALPYTGRKAERQAAYMAALDASEWRAMASEARARWSHQRDDAVRRVQAQARADVWDGMAAALDLVKASAGGSP